MLRDIRLAVAAVLVAATIAVVAFVRSAPAHPLGPSPSESESAPAAVSATSGRPSVALSVKSYGSDPMPNAPSAPTADVGQAKVWELDGRWWAALVEPSSGAFHIYGLDDDRRHWVDTGVVVDARPGVHPDAIISGDRLYVVSSARSRIASAKPEVRRYSYTRDRGWTLDQGFPVAAYDVGVSSPSIGRDTAGRVWVSFVDQGTSTSMQAAPTRPMGEPPGGCLAKERSCATRMSLGWSRTAGTGSVFSGATRSTRRSGSPRTRMARRQLTRTPGRPRRRRAASGSPTTTST
jgi:hypothetical protein